MGGKQPFCCLPSSPQLLLCQCSPLLPLHPSGQSSSLPLLQANLRRAYSNFNEEILESCAKQAEYRSIVFALCYFHAALLERKKVRTGPHQTTWG